MININNPGFVGLQTPDRYDAQEILQTIKPFILSTEKIMATFQGNRSSVVFTDKRIVSVNTQNMRDKKKDITSLPYNRLQAILR